MKIKIKLCLLLVSMILQIGTIPALNNYIHSEYKNAGKRFDENGSQMYYSTKINIDEDLLQDNYFSESLDSEYNASQISTTTDDVFVANKEFTKKYFSNLTDENFPINMIGICG